MKTDYDIAIVGAGMVGSAAACLFGAGGRRVALVEASLPAPPIDDTRIDLRVSAISRASQQVLERAGAWRSIAPAHLSPYRAMHVWDAAVPGDSNAVLRFDSARIGAPELGHIVENRRIVAALHAAVSVRERIGLFAPARLTGLTLGEQRATLELDDGRTLSTQLVVAADGAGSPTRGLAGIETTGWAYAQHALVTHIGTERPHEAVARQRFLPDGPLALLPLADGRCSIVWSTNPAHVAAMLEMSDAELMNAIGVASDHVLGAVTSVDRRAGFPLHLRHAECYVKPRLVLVGDAAHAVHPLAGQGANLGFADVAALLAVLADAAHPGDLAVLRRYERRRKGENLLMMGAIDALHRLFGSEHPLIGRARQTGMSLLDRLPGAKNLIVRRAMGA